MSKSYIPVTLLLTLLVSLSGGSVLFAQDDTEYRMEVDVGYRFQAGFRGSEDLYRTQVNLGEGLKLFGFNFFISPAEGKNNIFDHLEIRMADWGGEPYRTAYVRMAKNGIYELNFSHQKFDYFSSIPTFANPLLEKGNTVSQHLFDTTFQATSLELRFRQGKKISPFFAYQHTGRDGPFTTTVHAGNDEFLLNSDLDIRSDDFRIGSLFSTGNLSVIIEQGFRWYKDQTQYTGEAQDGNSTRPIIGRDVYLDGYEGGYNVRTRVIPYSIAKATWVPLDILTLEGRVSYSMADTRTNFYESMSGYFLSFPELRAFYDASQSDDSGKAKSPNLFVDVSAELRPVERFRLIERFRTHRYHISASALIRTMFQNVDPLLGGRFQEKLLVEVPFSTFTALDLNVQELEGQFDLFPEVTIRAGHRYVTKDYRRIDQFGYKRNVLVLGATYKNSNRNWVGFDYELGRTDQAIVRTDTVDFNRLRIRGRATLFDTLEINGRATLLDNDNDVIDFMSENRGLSLQLSYAPFHWFSFGGQWDRVRFETEIPYVIPQTFTRDIYTFRELSNYGNVFLSIGLIRNALLTAGYSVWGNSGNFPVNYHQPFAKLEVPLGENLVAYGQWNHYDYNEKVHQYPQDYRTHLGIIGIRVRMGN